MDVIGFVMGVNGVNNSVLTSVSIVLTCMSAFFFTNVSTHVSTPLTSGMRSMSEMCSLLSLVSTSSTCAAAGSKLTRDSGH